MLSIATFVALYYIYGMDYTLAIPCKPVVKQYLVNNYGPKVNLPSGSLEQKMILNLLHRQQRHFDSVITLQHYTATVEVKISYENFEDYGTELSKSDIRAFNTTIEKIIHKHLYFFLSFYIGVCGFKEKDAIFLYQQLFMFHEEVWSFESIKKHYQRNIQPYMHPVKVIGANVPKPITLHRPQVISAKT